MFINRKVTEQKQNNENILSQAIDTYVYDDSSNNDKNCESDDLIQCMSRQYERAITRLIAYRFIQIFIQKLLQIDDKKNHIQIFLTIFLPFLRNKNIEWTYLENIPAINNQLKEYIGNNYYSIIRHCLTYFLELETIEKTTILRTIFYLLNLFNTAADIHNYDLIEKLFTYFVSFIKTSDRKASNKTSKMVINKFFNDTLFSIGNHCRLQNTTNEIMTELIYIYRTIISCKSSWQIMALEIINNTMKLNFESSESIDMNQVNSILGSLHVFGGYIQPYCLGSVVEVNIDNEENNQTSLAVIIDINMDTKKVVASYFIQYIDTCKTKWISEDQLRIHIDVSPPNLLDLPNANEIIDSL
ncbi:unnamed protein product, partial [Rotaria sp. Silwood1]